MKFIAVFCSANDVDKRYVEPAIEFAKLIPLNGYGLVWGGSDTGLMKIVASTVQENNGIISGVSVEYLKERARENSDEMVIAKSLSERKSLMLEKSDAIVLMVGGIGTLDEIAEMVELKKHKIHSKPIIVLNTDSFYDGYKMQLVRMKNEGFIVNPLEEIIKFVDTPNEAMDYINSLLKP